MKWVTSRRLRINRAATAWLIRRFIDKDATFIFVAPEDVARVQKEEGAIGFHGRDTRYPSPDDQGRVSFRALVEDHCPNDAALIRMARIVQDADRPPKDRAPEAEAAGLRMITVAFPELTDDDHAILEKSAFLYDALYACLARGRK